jgi:hypothetical protein
MRSIDLGVEERVRSKDEAGAASIKQVLTSHPPNSRARFVDFSLSETGLQLTRS